MGNGFTLAKISHLANSNPITFLIPSHDPYYACQRCGNCCRWPGDVNVSPAEVLAIAQCLEMPEDQFIERYTCLNSKRSGLSLTEKTDGSCIFLEGQNRCVIQAVKPIQCAGFPNTWRFPGWRDLCEAVEVPRPPTTPD
jgi:Fe-S-cluster containining protein